MAFARYGGAVRKRMALVWYIPLFLLASLNRWWWLSPFFFWDLCSIHSLPLFFCYLLPFLVSHLQRNKAKGRKCVEQVKMGNTSTRKKDKKKRTMRGPQKMKRKIEKKETKGEEVVGESRADTPLPTSEISYGWNRNNNLDDAVNAEAEVKMEKKTEEWKMGSSHLVAHLSSYYDG